VDIWIIRDGEKIGPIHDFEVRRKIEVGELPAATPAWHEGMSEWKPLIEIELFTREFQLANSTHEVPEIPLNEARISPPPLPQERFYIRRFWARWFDLFLYSGLWWLGMWAAGQNIGNIFLNPWIMFLHYVPWFVLEVFLIHRFGTTPGKWLLGLHVTNLDGSHLDLAQATHRTVRVMFAGVGFGWGLLTVFCQVLSIFTAKRLGNTLWDHAGGHQVSATPLIPARLIVLIALYAASVLLYIIVVSATLHKIWLAEIPEFKNIMPNNPVWQLPDRTREP